MLVSLELMFAHAHKSHTCKIVSFFKQTLGTGKVLASMLKNRLNKTISLDLKTGPHQIANSFSQGFIYLYNLLPPIPKKSESMEDGKT